MVVDKDQNGKDIVEGSKVMNWWMVSGGVNHYKIHTIIYDDKEKSFRLSGCYNNWKGREVLLVEGELAERFKNIPDNQLFYYDPKTSEPTVGIYLTEEDKEFYKKLGEEQSKNFFNSIN